jgi:ABC-type Fe3+-siderophore transport system permease subunit
MSVLKRRPKRLEFDSHDTQRYLEKGKIREFTQPTAYDLNSFLDKDDFRIDWNRRRVRIDISLLFMGFLLGIIVCGMLLSVFREKPIDPNLSYIFSGAIWALLLSFVTILGTYCFGPSFEAGNYRRATATMFSSMNNKSSPMAGVTATTTTATSITPEEEQAG